MFRPRTKDITSTKIPDPKMLRKCVPVLVGSYMGGVRSPQKQPLPRSTAELSMLRRRLLAAAKFETLRHDRAALL